MRCPFMLANADVLKRVIAEATPEQRSAAQEWPKRVKEMGYDIRNPGSRAFFVVGWLRRLGENPSDWGPRGTGRRVSELKQK